LNEFVGKHPPVLQVFWAFRIMVGVGVLMLAVSWLAAWQLKRKGETHPWLTRALIGMSFSGWVATVAGWYVTEIGRQPFLVYGVLRTADAATTFFMYLTTYVLLTISYISVVFYLARKAGEPSKDTPSPEVAGASITPQLTTSKQ
jgi:cytochrome d ubiquinol oxidase subunit I